jgi:hypothetical protein
VGFDEVNSFYLVITYEIRADCRSGVVVRLHALYELHCDYIVNIKCVRVFLGRIGMVESEEEEDEVMVDGGWWMVDGGWVAVRGMPLYRGGGGTPGQRSGRRHPHPRDTFLGC